MRHEPIVAERVVVGRHEDAKHGESGRHVERKEAGSRETRSGHAFTEAHSLYTRFRVAALRVIG